MILHCVFLKMPATMTSADILKLYGAVAALKPLLPGMIEFNAGPNESPEGLGHGFKHGFVVTFADAAARDAYLIHPEHVKVGERIVAAAEGGLDGIFVYDIKVRRRVFGQKDGFHINSAVKALSAGGNDCRS